METLRMRRGHQGKRGERTLRAIPSGGSECVLQSPAATVDLHDAPP